MERPVPFGAHIHLRLPAEPGSVAAAHHSVFGIASALDPTVLGDVRLLISELVTNCIRHGNLSPDDAIDLDLNLEEGSLRVEVADRGPGFDPGTVGVPDPPGGRGWGLAFVEQIASRWGVQCDERTVVWFEVEASTPARTVSRRSPAGRNHR